MSGILTRLLNLVCHICLKMDAYLMEQNRHFAGENKVQEDDCSKRLMKVSHFLSNQSGFCVALDDDKVMGNRERMMK